MGVIDNLIYKPIGKAAANYLRSQASNNVEKATTPAPGQAGKMVRRNSLDYNIIDQNTPGKPHGSVSFAALRSFSRTHEISRICINARKRQITSLDWDIVAADPEDKTNYTDDIDLVKAYFKNMGAYRMRFNKLQDMLIEDLLVLDAAVLYKQRDRAGNILYYMPVDGSTIKLRVDQQGNTPEPPEIAYKQFIRGQLTGAFTADQMVYEMINPRTDSPYGLAPLESLILVVTSALKSTLYNLDFLTAGNIPEGLLSMPENWSAKQIEEYMTYFDSLVAGNSQETAKMKAIPGGSTFTETSKRSDMAFSEFNNWLMQLTCAMFDVQPQEIGFTMNVNKANGSEQNDITTRKGILPLTNLLTEMWNDAIQIDLGFPQLKFTYLGLEDRDQLAEAQADAANLAAGIFTVDEIRKSKGLEPIGIDTPYVIGQATFLTEAVVNPQTETPIDEEGTMTSTEAHDAQTEESGASELIPATPPVAKSDLASELKRFEKYAAKRLKSGKSLRKFESDVIDPELLNDLNDSLAKCETVADTKIVLNAVKENKPIEKAQTDYGRNPTMEQLENSSDYKKFRDDMMKAIMAQAVWTSEQLSQLDDKYISKDLGDLSSEQKAQLGNYFSNNMPTLSEAVTAAAVATWFTKVYNTSVNNLYKAVGNETTTFKLASPYYEGQINNAADYLLNKSSLDETTRKALINLIADDKSAGMTVAEISKDITSQFEDISSTRAALIAHTETANIMNQAQFAALKNSGVMTKSWAAFGPDPCSITCLPNSGDGDIPMDSFFGSGDLMPPGHPRCECALDFSSISISDGALWDGN